MKRLIIIILLIFYLPLAIAQQSLSPSENTGIKILVDNSPPIIEIISPKNITYNNATSLLINFTIIEHSLDSIWYSLNNQQNITIFNPFYINLPEGPYTLIIYANDSRNRINSSRVYFSINNSIPSCSDSICSINENCNLCPQDCGICPAATGNGGGSSGGGGGGGSIPATETTKENEEDKASATDNNPSFEEKTPQEKIKENEQRIKVNYKIILLFIIPLLIIISLIILYKFINQKNKKMKWKNKK